ncbi:aminopeptidase P family protein [Hoeflea poritis]|uniref:Aminopeptidase P family protein n=1 Tax=Hoeflea poritis TaxID=2993659 RepID=A0ABT4VPC2_9HYPH|nr:aminopeptidase P family protein [Hoeflea poritis]MDA4846474.1 aminopeptidase P family protein [Hoeflea poritis]
MFQSFDVTATAAASSERLERLRTCFDEAGIDALLVPRSDRFQGEYVPESEARLAWLTGFTGSAGVALVLRDSAHVFVDGRYATQVRQEVDLDLFTPEDLIKNPPRIWLEKNAPQGLRIGIDPWLHTLAEARVLEKAARKINGTLVRLESNPVDAIWHDRPDEPVGSVSMQPDSYAGQPAREKLAQLAEAVKEAAADTCVITDPSSIAWLFNIRGSDVPHTPHPLAFAIIGSDGKSRLFLDDRKLGKEAAEYLADLTGLQAPGDFETALAAIGKEGAKVMLDPNLAPARVAALITEAGGTLVEEADPARLPRAQKNAVELAGSRTAHERDGAAMVSFLAWLDRQQPGTVDEISAVRNLEEARRATGERLQMPLLDISFDTISGAGPNGAVIHYRVNTDTNRTLNRGEIYLVDSGGQYRDGTTDITRTVPVGPVGNDEKRFFTLVLKGMIALTLMRFPEGTRGIDIDAIARMALWKAGADYAHGTGHGVGSYLSVHEGPQSISRRGLQELKPGMILSNEPGYYHEGAFGIRIENLVAVNEAAPIEGGDNPMLGFETLTLCPIDRRLVVADLLSPDELAWLNGYHNRVRDVLAPLVGAQEDRDWLAAMTAPISQDRPHAAK